MRELERNREQTNPSLPPVAIVGAGRVGNALARAATATGLRVTLLGRESFEERLAEAEVVLLSVPDGAIEEARDAVDVAAPRLRFLGHTSGATTLTSLANTRAQAFSIHPLQTVPDGDADLAGAPCAVAGATPEALALAEHLSRALGMRPFEVPEQARAAYHAAAAIASNFLVALEESAAELLREAGIENPRELLAPLVLRSAANWSERGREALTGPIARGDEATIELHLEALAATHPSLLQTYEALAERTRALAATEAMA
jgi:predicted short-subunit dehydrogenase-like oxidoreductase (DUF2520 family)